MVYPFSQNKTTIPIFANSNASERPYFNNPKATFQPYFTDTYSNTNYNHNQRFVIAYPVLALKSISETKKLFNITGVQNIDNAIDYSNLLTQLRNNIIDNNNNNNETRIDNLKNMFEFKGVVVAYIDNVKFDNFIDNAILTIKSNGNNKANKNYSNYYQSQFNMLNQPPISQSFPPLVVTIFDKSGKVMSSNSPLVTIGATYNSTESLQKIKNRYDEKDANKVISTLNFIFHNKDQKNSSFKNSFLNSINGITLDLTAKPDKRILETNRFIVNYQAILLNNSPILYLYTANPVTISSMANQQIGNQIVFNIIFIISLLAVVFSFIAVGLLINKKLKEEVKKKTSQLKEHVMKLEKSNEDLNLTKQALEEINKEVLLANEKLIHNDEKQRDFVNTAAHELRTPTQAISGYSELNDMIYGEILNDATKIIPKNEDGKVVDYIVSSNEILHLIKYHK